jgi:hypothetical protein
MTHATITTNLYIGDSVLIEVDGDYWRYEDEKVTDLTLCRLFIYETDDTGQSYGTEILHGLDRPSRLAVERNLFRLNGMTERLCRDIEAQGEDLHIEPDHDPKDDL